MHKKIFTDLLHKLKLYVYVFILINFIILKNGADAASLIRDEEIENVIREITTPIFKTAGLSPQSINIYIANDKDINAYVAGGQNIFINTGLLQLSESPDMLVGVIAHETGHIAGGHLILGQKELGNTLTQSTMGFLLGIAATATGSAETGKAIIAGTSHIAEREILANSREHEEEADHAAFTYLEKIKYSANGMLELMRILYNQENTFYSNLNPYTLTHPLTSERMTYINSYVKTHNNNQKLAQNLLNKYILAITKLKAFLNDPKSTLDNYKESDNSDKALYARSIAYYRIPDLNKALTNIDILIKKEPTNPYYLEMKAQILFENGRVDEAILNYEQVKKILPNSAIIQTELATAYLATEKKEMALKAADNLEQALIKEKDNPALWHQLATAYGITNQFALSDLALAEENFLIGKVELAEEFIKKADKNIKPGSIAENRKNDLLNAIKRKKQQNKIF